MSATTTTDEMVRSWLRGEHANDQDPELTLDAFIKDAQQDLARCRRRFARAQTGGTPDGEYVIARDDVAAAESELEKLLAEREAREVAA